MEYKDYIGPFNQSKYDFVIENSVDLKDNWIQHAELSIDRTKYQIKLNELLNDIDIAIDIELSIFEYALNYCLKNKYDKNYIKPVYEDKFNFLVSNIDPTNKFIKNLNLKSLLLKKKINPKYLAFMSAAQLHPDKWSYILKKKEYVEHRENNIAYSDAYKCFKCGESKCKITQAQTRSADEPMTTFVVCLVCHNTFKFS
jgi:DNA-directed RNA polymerase subunit M/transcription elongation factor TFIIS